MSNGKTRCKIRGIKLLGLKINHELNFDEHVSSLHKKSSQKLNALSEIAYCMRFD